MFKHNGVQSILNEEKPTSSLMNQNVVPYTCYIAWFSYIYIYIYDWFPILIRLL